MAAVAVFSLIVCRSVASGRTTERCQVAQCGMALTALRPLAPVIARVDSEICSVVIHRVWCPYARAMAEDTIRGQQLGHMVRIARPGIVCRMTLVAILIREGIVAVDVTLSTLESSMSAGQRKLGCRMVERCGFPGRLSVALQTVMAKLSDHVIGIDDSVEGRGMAVPAPRVRQPLEHIVHMALVAGHGLMGPDESEGRRHMGERGRTPDGCGVAGSAIVIEVSQHVVGIGRLGELRRMTHIAIGVLQLIVAVRMALGTLGGRMSTGQRELRCRMVERCGFPGRLGMALQTVMGELPGYVVGIDGSVEGRSVAVPAAGVGESTEYIVHVALVTRNGLMGTDELEGRRRMGERGRTPYRCGVASLASGCEVCRRMIGVLG